MIALNKLYRVRMLLSLDVADKNGVMSIGYNFDNSADYPDTYLTSAVWSIVNTAVFVKGIISQLMAVNFHSLAFSCSADNTLGKHSLAHFGKKGNYINPHRQKYLSWA